MENKVLNEAVLFFNKLQSENYDGATHDLEPAQDRIYKLLNEMKLERGLVRLAIDCHPNVRKLRNQLDEGSLYSEQSISQSEISKNMRPDVLKLMSLRNETSRLLGYKDYVNAILEADNVTIFDLKSLLNKYLNKHLLSVPNSASKNKISMSNWFTWLYDNSELESVYEPMLLLKEFANNLEMNYVLTLLDIKVDDSFCYACQTSDNNILIQISPIKRISDLCTLFHEFGHACVYAKTPKHSLPYLSSLVDEVIAVLFENAGIRFLGDEQMRKSALEYLHTEYTRTCISGLFELDLWNDSSNPEMLYSSWYTKLGVNVNEEDWAIDSFRYIDCMTIFAYTIGQEIADSLTNEKLKNCINELINNTTNLTLCDLIKYVERN